MKVGQIASVIDLEGLPPDARDRFQAKLASLRDSAPQVSFKDMRRVIEDDLGERIENIFDHFEEHAVAAASIGQVYRARLDDGQQVAVKVQYPRVAAAARADLQNIGLLLQAVKRLQPALDAKAVAAELRERLGDELDYEHEADAQRGFARRFDGHPLIVIPRVFTELSGEHVLVTEWVDGQDFEAVKQLDQATRDRFGEIVFRFFFGSLYRDGDFSGDPHPGNYKLLPDGRVAFSLLSEDGREADWVKDIEASPRVRVKVRSWTHSAWRAGTAQIVDDDDPRERQRLLSEGNWARGLCVRASGALATNLLTVRIDLDAANPGGVDMERGSEQHP
jgi:predicted unusual protein kinase regulating ubiquinone biosynthesis (AarF/ABC1/UbiB family)